MLSAAVKTISAAEASRQFSTLLRRVGKVETLTVTSRGRPVATISPPIVDTGDIRREQARERLRQHLETVRPSGSARDWTRGELHD